MGSGPAQAQAAVQQTPVEVPQEKKKKTVGGGFMSTTTSIGDPNSRRNVFLGG